MEVSPRQNEKIHDRPNSCGNISLKPTEILEHQFTRLAFILKMDLRLASFTVKINSYATNTNKAVIPC